MQANGDNKTQLTNRRASASDPAFSPNGKKIAFASERSGNGDIYTMSANVTDKKQLTTSKKDELIRPGRPAAAKLPSHIAVAMATLTSTS